MLITAADKPRPLLGGGLAQLSQGFCMCAAVFKLRVELIWIEEPSAMAMPHDTAR